MGHYQKGRPIIVIGLLLLWPFLSAAQDSQTDTRPGIAPDIREDEVKLKLQRGDFVAVPIPISNPTLDTGLVAGAAYFYPQTEEQKATQPASLTAIAGMYTSNDSRAAAIVQQNYWKQNKWRFTGVFGAADLRLPLIAPDESSSGQSVDWRVDGGFLLTRLSRRIGGNWYGGISGRIVDASQKIEGVASNEEFDVGSDFLSVGLGLSVEYDTRDMPTNSYTGRYLKLDALFNDEEIGSNRTYQNYSASFRSYHTLTESTVLAWEVQGCKRSGKVPLWDGCTVKLRGFSATDYLGKKTSSGQAEIRWKLSKRWGLVGFGGVGRVGDSFSGIRDNENIPSYGIGLRFMVLLPKRINMRLDFARSTDSDAIHFSVGEAF